MNTNIGMKKIIIVICVVALLIIWAFAVVHVNTHAEKTVYQYYNLNEDVAYKGYDIKVCNYEKLTPKEMEKKYNIVESDAQSLKTIYFVIWMEISNANNKSEVSISEALDGTLLVSLAKSNMCDGRYLNEDGEESDIYNEEILPSKSKKIGMVFSLAGEILAKRYRESIEKYPLYIQFSDYDGSRYIRKIRLN